MRIEIWSDIVCPWCYVGSRRLDRALESFAHAGDVEVLWRSYELDPGAPAERGGSYVTHLSRKYGIPVEEASARLDHIVSVGAEAGVDLRFDEARPGNTFDAHRLLHLAGSLGVQRPSKERLLSATFTEGRPIGDRDTLVELAGDVGISGAEARRVLDGDAFAADVRADEAQARAIGVQGVPFFVFDRRLAVPGAQPSEILLEVLEGAWRDAGPRAPVDVPDGDGCGDDACGVRGRSRSAAGSAETPG